MVVARLAGSIALWVLMQIATVTSILLIPFIHLTAVLYRLVGIRVEVEYSRFSFTRMVHLFALFAVVGLGYGLATGWHEVVVQPISQAASRVFPSSFHGTHAELQIRAVAKQYGVPPELALAIAQWETGMSHYDRFGQVKRSHADAIGMFQLKMDTASDMGIDPYDPAENILGGVRYIRFLMTHFDHPSKRKGYNVPEQLKPYFRQDPVAVLTAAAYHAGIGRVTRSRGIPDQPGGEWDEPLWRETIKYTIGILHLMRRF